MKRTCLFLVVALSILLITVACSLINSKKGIAQTIEIDLSSGIVLQNTDTHGGFQGDGDTYIKMTFPDDEGKILVEEIENNTEWDKLPLTHNLNIAVYGEESKSVQVAPLITNDNGERYFPWINNGYYFFLDRHSESRNEKDDTELFNRMSFNFTIAIYDTENHVLHYYELDT